MQTFDAISSAVWDRLVEKAAELGITITGHSGTVSKEGFTGTWNYDPNTETLQIQCTDSPWWAPCALINGKIREIVESSR
jgi:hypothetical protein